MTHPLIAFLDALGRQPKPADFNAQVAALAVDATVREALIGRDAEALTRAYGAEAAMWCMVLSPEEKPVPGEDCPDEAPDHEPEQPQPDSPPDREAS